MDIGSREAGSWVLLLRRRIRQLSHGPQSRLFSLARGHPPASAPNGATAAIGRRNDPDPTWKQVSKVASIAITPALSILTFQLLFPDINPTSLFLVFAVSPGGVSWPIGAKSTKCQHNVLWNLGRPCAAPIRKKHSALSQSNIATNGRGCASLSHTVPLLSIVPLCPFMPLLFS